MPEMDVRKRVVDAFVRRYGHPPEGIARAPGRVNLLGEHVDYNDGFVLPAAIDRATYVAFAPSGQESTRVMALDFAAEATFSPETLEGGKTVYGAPLPTWAKYPAGVAWTLSAHGLSVRAIDAVIASEVPRGAGLSSSASVELAFATAWQVLGGWSLAPMELAQLCQRAENEYVGVRCGIMDQATSACGEADRVLLIDCRTLEYRALPLPPLAAIVVADTGVRHALAASDYNDRRFACEQAVQLLRARLGGIRALRDVTPADFQAAGPRLPPEIRKRARHVVEEIERTRRATPMLEAGDLPGFGKLMNASHASLRDLYEVSCRELDVMARIAQSLDGCFGARMTGAGFGGCTVNLVAQTKLGAFVEALKLGYESETGRAPDIHVCQASDGANIL